MVVLPVQAAPEKAILINVFYTHIDINQSAHAFDGVAHITKKIGQGTSSTT